MSRKKLVRTIVIFQGATLLLLLIILLLKLNPSTTNVTEKILLSNRTLQEVASITVENEYGNYKILQQEGGFIVENIPAENVNVDYLKLVLEESSTIEALEKVETKGGALAQFGLELPSATVTVNYTDNELITLLIGAEEPISKDRYVKTASSDDVYIVKAGKTVRYLSPISVFIDYLIVPYTAYPSPFSAIGDVSIAGKEIEQKIEIKAVKAGDVETLRTAASFGAATHLVNLPVVSELDQGYGAPLFNSMIGLLNEGVLAYNVSDQQLTDYGFDEPLYEIIFEFTPQPEAETKEIRLRISQFENEFLVVKDNEKIVHKISTEEAITNIEPEKMPLRWFLTPFVTDIAGIELIINEENYSFELVGEGKDLAVNLNGHRVDTEEFRKYYTLLISAQNDSKGISETVNKEQQANLELTFKYKDTAKPNDQLTLYSLESRTLLVEVNGTAKYTMNEKYLATLETATKALLNGEDFVASW